MCDLNCRYWVVTLWDTVLVTIRCTTLCLRIIKAISFLISLNKVFHIHHSVLVAVNCTCTVCEIFAIIVFQPEWGFHFWQWIMLWQCFLLIISNTESEVFSLGLNTWWWRDLSPVYILMFLKCDLLWWNKEQLFTSNLIILIPATEQAKLRHW